MLADILGDDVPPLTDGDRLGEWLAARGVGLVPIADPAAFAWPGHWIAVTTLRRAVAMYGVPSAPLTETLAPGESVVAGYVLAPHDLDLERTTARVAGRVDALVIAPKAAGPAEQADRCEAIAGRGLVGDRYAGEGGTFSSPGRLGQDLTLIDSGALAIAGIDPVEARRNIVTSGIDLDGLIGRRFRIGPVECRGERRAEPCAHLQRLTRPGVLRALVHRGGIRADVLVGGEIAVGDVIAAIAP